MKQRSLPAWAEIFQIGLSLLFAISPAIAIAYLQGYSPADQLFVAHHFHEVAITVAVAVSLFLAYLAYRCHQDSGEPLTRQLALAFFGFAILYAPHGILTFMAGHHPPLFLLWGPTARLVMACYVLRGLLAPQRIRPVASQSWWPDLAALVAVAFGVGILAGGMPQYFTIARIGIEAAAGIISLAGLVVLLATRATGPILWFHAVALIWFALASTAFLLGKPWNAQWWLAHAISAAGFLLLGWGVAHVYRTSQRFSAFYSPERLFSLLSNAERLADELRAAKETAEHSMHTKSTFLAAASHDLRQPTQALTLFTAALRAKLPPDHPATAVVSCMEEATAALQSILDGLLDVSRLDAGLVASSPADTALAPVLAEVVERARRGAAGKSITFVTQDSGLQVHTDPALLQTILGKLMDNAVKFTDRGRIVLTSQIAGSSVRIGVTDNGPGIPQDQQEAIFDEFVQLANPERDRTKGLGLGLTIARRLTTLLGGRMGVDSQPGQGATFWVELPAASPSPQ